MPDYLPMTITEREIIALILREMRRSRSRKS
jgi:hypothetical protein